jgi:hemerythrin
VDRSSPKHLVVAEIEREHSFLSAELARLRELLSCGQMVEHCKFCHSHKRAHCQNGIDGFLMEFLIFMQQHFAHEDSSMRKADITADVREAFEQHIEAHADMMEHLTNAIRSATARHQSQELVDLIERWLREHITTHDMHLLDWLKQQPDQAPQPG